MSDDLSHETLFRNFLPLPAPPQRNTHISMPVISEECPPDSPTSTAIPNASRTPTPNDMISKIGSFPKTIRRRSSHLQRWIEDQLTRPHSAGAAEGASTDTLPHGTAPHPYLAYPGITPPRFGESDPDDSRTLESYVLVDDDGPGSSHLQPEDEDVFQVNPATPPVRSSPTLSTGATPRPSSGIFHAAPSLRNLHLSLPPSRRKSAENHKSPSPTSRHSFLPRPHTRNGHTRETSIPSLASAQPNTVDGPSTTRISKSHNSWRFKRPNVLSAFSSPSHSPIAQPDPVDEMPPPRPSFSSVNTFSSGTTGTSNVTTSHKPAHGSQRAPPVPRFKSPSPSMWSLPRDASHLHDPPGSETVLSLRPATGIRIPFAHRTPRNSMPMRRVPSVLVSQEKKKKKLVIGGVGIHDERRVDGVRRWCESFGEVNQITRAQNGDLHIDFRRSEVADTVCRLNARVHIAGVGSVSLSWYTGKKH